MSARVVRIGALGCSAIAWRRALPAMAACPSTVVTAVASRDADKAGRFADRFGARPMTYEQLLDSDDVDAVYLSLPAALHLPWGSRVLNAGKHLLVEKPAAVTAEDVRELARVAAGNRLVVRENLTFPHHPAHARVRRMVEDGRLGVARSLSAEFCFPPLPDDDIRYRADLAGGALLDAGVYPVRAAQMFLGPDLTVVGAVMRMCERRGVDLSGQALLTSATGALATLHFGFEHAYSASYTLWGSAARLRLERAFSPHPSWQPAPRLEEQDHTETFAFAAADQFERAVESFADAVLGGRDAAHPDEVARWRETVTTLELVETIARHAVRIPVGAETGTGTGA